MKLEKTWNRCPTLNNNVAEFPRQKQVGKFVRATNRFNDNVTTTLYNDMDISESRFSIYPRRISHFPSPCYEIIWRVIFLKKNFKPCFPLFLPEKSHFSRFSNFSKGKFRLECEHFRRENRENDGQNDTKIRGLIEEALFTGRSSSEWRLETRATERNRARVQPNVATRVHWRNSWSEGAGLNRFNPSSQHPTPSRILLSKNSEFPLESIGVDPRKHLGRRGLAEFLERLVV